MIQPMQITQRLLASLICLSLFLSTVSRFTPVEAARRTDNNEQELLQAVLNGETERVRSLLQTNKKLAKAKDAEGTTPLHLAARTGHYEIARLLLMFDADAKAKTRTDVTPLHLAAQSSEVQIVNLLLSRKANVEAKDKNGRRPSDYAAAANNEDLASALRSKEEAQAHHRRVRNTIIAIGIAVAAAVVIYYALNKDKDDEAKSKEEREKAAQEAEAKKAEIDKQEAEKRALQAEAERLEREANKPITVASRPANVVASTPKPEPPRPNNSNVVAVPVARPPKPPNRRVELDIPFVEQQAHSWDCGPNSAQRMLRYYGINHSYSTVLNVTNQHRPALMKTLNLGTTPHSLRDAIKGLGRAVSLKRETNLNEVISAVMARKPVIALLRVGSKSVEVAVMGKGTIVGGVLDKVGARPNITASYPLLHWVVIRGVDQDAKLLLLQNPNGAPDQWITYDEFSKKWNWSVGSGVVKEALDKEAVTTRTILY